MKSDLKQTNKQTSKNHHQQPPDIGIWEVKLSFPKSLMLLLI